MLKVSCEDMGAQCQWTATAESGAELRKKIWKHAQIAHKDMLVGMSEMDRVELEARIELERAPVVPREGTDQDQVGSRLLLAEAAKSPQQHLQPLLHCAGLKVRPCSPPAGEMARSNALAPASIFGQFR